MLRTLAAGTLLLTAASWALAQPEPSDGVVRLTVSPAALPSPSLKYRLLPDRREQTPGNAADLYYRSLAMFTENRFLLADFQEDHWDRWFIMPVKDLPLKEVREKTGAARNLLHEVELATLCRQCDWELEGRPDRNGLLFPPDLRGFRREVVILGVRARADMAEGQFPEAAQSLRTGYAVAHHLGQGPTFGHVLAGEVCANLMTKQLEDLVQQPKAPNLYWSLAVLPQPLFKPQTALQEEGRRAERLWPWLARLENGPMSAAQVSAAREQTRKALEEFGLTPPEEKLIDEAYPEAKRALIDQGVAAEQVGVMPAFQVVGLHALRQYHAAWDEYAKWFAVAGGWREPGCRKSAEGLREATARLNRLFFGGLLRSLEVTDPAVVEKVYHAMDRHERRVAALRCVEAVRLYAAAQGKLPKALADVTNAPAPADPLTGKPFEYSADGDKAKLTAPVPPGDQDPPSPPFVYELTLRR
jgi:hypothetical protein